MSNPNDASLYALAEQINNARCEHGILLGLCAACRTCNGPTGPCLLPMGHEGDHLRKADA